jgi:hypothetical protein
MGFLSEHKIHCLSELQRAKLISANKVREIDNLVRQRTTLKSLHDRCGRVFRSRLV